MKWTTKSDRYIYIYLYDTMYCVDNYIFLSKYLLKIMDTHTWIRSPNECISYQNESKYWDSWINV